MSPLALNERAARYVEAALTRADELHVSVQRVEGGGRIVDCGVEAPGGLEAGLFLARLTLADLACVSLAPPPVAAVPWPHVTVYTDHPIAACMASQYAGWRISSGDFFAMGSGPMRAAYAGEELFAKIGHRESAEHAVGALEARRLPDRAVFEGIASRTGVEASAITLAVAPTSSIAGGIQVVARSVETALHKLSELGFDLDRIASGFGYAPLPPPAADDLDAIGRTNDAVLYGASVTLWVRGDDRSLEEIGPRVPSSASRDHGQPFRDVFARYGHDFYKVDPALFSPAEVTFSNLESGRTHSFGTREPDVVLRSFRS